MAFHHRRPIGRGNRQGLDTRFLIVGNRHHGQAASLLPPKVFIDDFDFFIDMQHLRHFGLELRVPLLHVVANFMRPQFALAQDFMQLGATQLLQFRMTSRHTVLAHVGGQQLVGP